MKKGLFNDTISEHSEQAMFCQYLDIKHLPYFAIPNGIFLKDKQTASRIIAKQKAEGLKSGVPDLFIPVSANGFHGLFVEMKRAKGGSASKDQRAWIELLRLQGYKAEVCHGCRSAIHALDDYLKRCESK